MSTLISADNAAGTTTPNAVEGYAAGRDSRNIIHDLIGGGIAVVLIAPRPRSGQLVCWYDTEEDAYDALQLHAEETSFTLTNTDRDTVAMTYVLPESGSASYTLDASNGWKLMVDFQEIDPV